MNERIKEISEQARKEVRAEWDKGNKHLYPEAHYAFQNDNDVRLAELIIKEVCNIVLHYSNVDEGVAVVKRNFGIEE